MTRRAIIAGAGASGLLHALAFRSAGVAIAAIYDPTPGRAALLADLVGGEPLARAAQELDDERLEGAASLELQQELSMALWWAGELGRSESLLKGLIEAAAAMNDSAFDFGAHLVGLVESGAVASIIPGVTP